MNYRQPEWNVGLPQDQRNGDLRRQIAEWINAPVLRQLASAFDASPPRGDADELLAWYGELSARRWDFRAGRERNLAERPELEERQTVAALQAAETLGLISPAVPSRDSYDYCLILGGLVRACVTRPRYAADLATRGIAFGQIIALGGFRPLRGDEVDLATRIGIVANNEFGAMDAGLRRAFGINATPIVASGDSSEANHDWRIHEYSSHNCSVVAAPSSDPDMRRANSADTFVWWARRAPNLSGAHILLVTNPIYVPYQGAAATQILAMRFGVQVETVGISRQAADLGPDTQAFSAANYLQEIHSSIRGMQSLYDAARA